MLHTIVRFMVRKAPVSMSFTLIKSLAGMTNRPSLKPRDRDILAGAQVIRFGKNKKRGWSWGEGPLVVLVHGWCGRSGQMVSLADGLAKDGFKVAVFDATAHGESKGRYTTFGDLCADIHEFTRSLGQPVYGYVGHSAGGLCLMAARRVHGIEASRFVCLNAPMYPYVPIEQIDRILSPPKIVLDRFRDFYARQLGAEWEDLEQGQDFKSLNGSALFVVYDEDDDRVKHGDGDRILAIQPGVRLMKTKGLGHLKILWDDSVKSAVSLFLKEP